jgi:hypothetical protein
VVLPEPPPAGDRTGSATPAKSAGSMEKSLEKSGIVLYLYEWDRWIGEIGKKFLKFLSALPDKEDEGQRALLNCVRGEGKKDKEKMVSRWT